MDFGESEVKDFGVSAIGDEDVGGLDVAMDDAFRVSGIEGVGDFDGEGENFGGLHGATRDAMFQRHAFEVFHGDEGLAVLLANVVDRTDVGVVERGGGLGFALEARKRLRVAGDVVG